MVQNNSAFKKTVRDYLKHQSSPIFCGKPFSPVTFRTHCVPQLSSEEVFTALKDLSSSITDRLTSSAFSAVQYDFDSPSSCEFSVSDVPQPLQDAVEVFNSYISGLICHEEGWIQKAWEKECEQLPRRIAYSRCGMRRVTGIPEHYDQDAKYVTAVLVMQEEVDPGFDYEDAYF